MNVCPPASPAASQNAAGIGRVATISEYTGTTERGASCADHASVARTTVPAVTTPRSVTTRRGPTAVAVVRLDDARRRGARRPARAPARAARAGCVRSPACTTRPAPAWRRRAPTPPPPGRSPPRPGPGAAAPGCGRGRSCRPSPSRRRCPPSATALPTSSTVSRIAAPIASAAARPCRRVSAASLAGNNAEHQPPLRPLAPKPATCALHHDARAGPGRRAAGGRPSRAR